MTTSPQDVGETVIITHNYLLDIIEAQNARALRGRFSGLEKAV
jgi:hypothetical protein